MKALFAGGMGCDSNDLHDVGVRCPKLGLVCAHSQKTKLRQKYFANTQGTFKLQYTDFDK